MLLRLILTPRLGVAIFISLSTTSTVILRDLPNPSMNYMRIKKDAFSSTTYQQHNFLVEIKQFTCTRSAKWDEIPLECRILSIADAYDAMTHDRPYRKTLSQVEVEVVNELEFGKGGQFDPDLLDLFIGLIEKAKL